MSLAWVGAIVAIAPLVLFMMSLVVIRRPRTWRNEYPLLIASAFGTGLGFEASLCPVGIFVENGSADITGTFDFGLLDPGVVDDEIGRAHV